MTEEEISGTDTDWIANCYLGYGIGYTKQQALQAMAASVRPSDDPVEVDLIEHVGDATMGMGGVRVDTFVSGERIEIQPEDFTLLREKAMEADVQAERIVDEPDNFVEEIER